MFAFQFCSSSLLGKLNPVSPCDLAWPGLLPLGVPVGRAGASGSGGRVGEVPVARTEGFFLAASAGRFIGPRLLARSERELECVCKGGFQAWPAPAGFAYKQRELQASGQPHDGNCVPTGPGGSSGALAPGAWGTRRGPKVFPSEKQNQARPCESTPAFKPDNG